MSSQHCQQGKRWGIKYIGLFAESSSNTEAECVELCHQVEREAIVKSLVKDTSDARFYFIFKTAQGTWV